MGFLGFETIGNATVICHDQTPILATDPWITGHAYFGSWGMSHKVPEAQLKSVFDAKFIWVSHGHPDHLHHPSLDLIKETQATLLMPEHYGSRIELDMKQLGFKVQSLPSMKWISLSENIRVFCIPDYNQDAVLLIDIAGHLVVNLNDASDRGWAPLVKKEISRFSRSTLLRLFCYGDVDMINFIDENGLRIPPPAAKKEPLGPKIARYAEEYGVSYVVPFSAMHKYQRSDSIWADIYSTPLEDFAIGFDSKTVSLLPAYIRFDVMDNKYSELNPELDDYKIYSPEDFGDDWSQTLSVSEYDRLLRYFTRFEHLANYLDYISFHVGGREYTIPYRNQFFKRGIHFYAPSGTLMNVVDNNIFDDLLISNIVSARLDGNFGERKLYPNFTPYVGKYGDNGLSYSEQQLENYFRHYAQGLEVVDMIKHAANSPINQLRRVVGELHETSRT